MCTVTWVRNPDGYELLFNRDELRTRAEAEPPRRHERDGFAWLAPVDRDAGGSWIAVNERGVAVALLNGYRVAGDRDPADFTSRGLLVADLATAPDRDAIAGRLEALDPSPFRSFRLLALVPEAPALVAEWDRRDLTIDRDAERRRPVISSSFEESEVGRLRRAEYAHVVGGGEPTLDRLLAYHRSTRNGPSAFSVSMERPEAATRSLTHATVAAGAVTMRYRPGPPHAAGPETVVRLPRSPLSSSLPPEEVP